MDLVTLSDVMEKNATLEKAGGMDYLTSLARTTPSAANYAYYLDIVKRDSTLRKLIRSADKISDESRNSTDYLKSVAFAEKCIYDISEQLDTSTLSNINTAFNGILDKYEKIQKDKDYFQGLKTGFTELDKLTNGLHAGNLIILAARPSIGKTTLAMNIVENIAIKEKAVCAVFALEMTKEELAQRMMCSVANVSNQSALKGKLEDEDWQKLWQAQKILNDTKIYVDDTSMTTCAEILSKCRRLKSREGLDLVVVDHIQLMNAIKPSDSRQQEITEISRGLKMIAKELDIPVIALSQLSRLVTGRKGQKPVLSDLRESGAIEQDADIVMFIHRPDLAAEEKELEQAAQEKSRGKKARGRNTPMLVATALPPRKPMKQENTWPSTQARATQVTGRGERPSHRARATGRAPLPRSQARVSTPQRKPHRRATLVAPVLRLPSLRGSMPQKVRAMTSPHGAEPST